MRFGKGVTPSDPAQGAPHWIRWRGRPSIRFGGGVTPSDPAEVSPQQLRRKFHSIRWGDLSAESDGVTLLPDLMRCLDRKHIRHGGGNCPQGNWIP